MQTPNVEINTPQNSTQKVQSHGRSFFTVQITTNLYSIRLNYTIFQLPDFVMQILVMRFFISWVQLPTEVTQ